MIPVTVYRLGVENGENKMYAVTSSTNISSLRIYYHVGFTLEKMVNIVVKNK